MNQHPALLTNEQDEARQGEDREMKRYPAVFTLLSTIHYLHSAFAVVDLFLPVKHVARLWKAGMLKPARRCVCVSSLVRAVGKAPASDLLGG